MVGLIVALSLSYPHAAQSKPHAGTTAMVARLAEISRTADIQKNSFLNSRRVRMISAVPEPTAPDKRVMYLYMLGQEQLLAGASAEAAAAFEKIGELVAKHPGLPFTESALDKVRTLRALAYLRLGEQENCVTRHNVERCLLPIRGSGVHTVERGSRAAVAAYTELLEESPGDLGYRWLLNLAYMTLGEHPGKVPEKWLIPAEAFASDDDVGRFVDVAPQLGLDVFGLSGGSIIDDFTGGTVPVIFVHAPLGHGCSQRFRGQCQQVGRAVTGIRASGRRGRGSTACRPDGCEVLGVHAQGNTDGVRPGYRGHIDLFRHTTRWGPVAGRGGKLVRTDEHGV